MLYLIFEFNIQSEALKPVFKSFEQIILPCFTCYLVFSPLCAKCVLVSIDIFYLNLIIFFSVTWLVYKSFPLYDDEYFKICTCITYW